MRRLVHDANLAVAVGVGLWVELVLERWLLMAGAVCG